MGSGLYEDLVSRGWLVPHEEVPDDEADPAHFRTLRPRPIDFVSHPHEWCFSQLKDAALLTLRIQRAALRFDMTLRDASAYNVQLDHGRPVFIDTLSFGHYAEGTPWVGYRQFCQHFLAPLALMSRRDVRLQRLLVTYLDGIPLDLAVALLPRRAWRSLGLALHLGLHARFQRRYEGAAGAGGEPPAARRVSKRAQLDLIRQLETTVERLDWRPSGTEWADYEQADSYEVGSLEHKKALVEAFLSEISPACVWDLGANTGVYSRIASRLGARVRSFDADPACVERSYREVRSRGEASVLPLRIDLTSPTPATGWNLLERASLLERRDADAVLALALIHHLAIAGNVPLPHISRFLAELAPHLVIEFVPRSDPKVRTLLATREDVFPDYTREGFEAAFGNDWRIVDAVDIEGSDRRLYRLARR